MASLKILESLSDITSLKFFNSLVTIDPPRFILMGEPF